MSICDTLLTKCQPNFVHLRVSSRFPFTFVHLCVIEGGNIKLPEENAGIKGVGPQ